MIVLIGFMGSGKSSVGRLVADRRDVPFTDTDDLIAERSGSTIAEIFEVSGEAAFRALERDVVLEVLGKNEGVVALGGGAITDGPVSAALGGHDVVYLDVEPAEALQRVGDSTGRPMLRHSDPAELLEERKPLYLAAAKFVVDTSDKTVDQVAAEVVARLSAEIRSIVVRTTGRSYRVVVGNGVSRQISSLAAQATGAEKAVVLTHPTLEAAATGAVNELKELGLDTHVVTVPEGEHSKSPSVAADLHDRLARIGVHRHDLVVTFGGGVVCDLGGFVASTYMRGLPVVHVPTTLLAQVDAAIGGKTAVNLELGKNLVGTFHQPIGVLCDVALLAGCPVEEIRSGLAEVVKYGLIAEPELLGLVASRADPILALDPDVVVELVTRCVAIKASIVSSDEKEEGERAFLNYGHTFAHAIEAVAGYEGIRHGEAVALGMMLAAHTARLLDRIDDEAVDRHSRALEAVGLPTRRHLDFATLEKAWEHDKKYRDGVRFVLLMDIGKPEAGVEVPRAVLQDAVERLAEGGNDL